MKFPRTTLLNSLMNSVTKRMMKVTFPTFHSWKDCAAKFKKISEKTRQIKLNYQKKMTAIARRAKYYTMTFSSLFDHF